MLENFVSLPKFNRSIRHDYQRIQGSLHVSRKAMRRLATIRSQQRVRLDSDA